MTQRIATFAILALLAIGIVGCSNPVSGTPAASYTVSYDGNTAEAGSAPTDGKSYQAAAKVIVADNTGGLAKTDQLFTGWNTKADGSGTNYAVGNSFAMGSGNVTLYAVWVSSDRLTINGTTVSAGLYPPVGDLIIPPGVTDIDVEAFYYCNRLTSVTIPNSVTSIGKSAFEGCVSLKSVSIPSSVAIIGPFAFANTGLTSVNLPESVTKIEESTFYECTNLTSVSIPNTVTSIGIGAFEDCYSLTNVSIPSSVATIGPFAFAGTGLTAVNIPENISRIEESTFTECTKLTSVTIPSWVTLIDMNAFSMCTELSSVTIRRSFVSQGSITILGRNAFRNCAENLILKVPSDSLTQYLADFTWKPYGSRISGY